MAIEIRLVYPSKIVIFHRFLMFFVCLPEAKLTFPQSPGGSFRSPQRGRQGQLGTGPNKAERAQREREAILKQLEAGGAFGPGMGWWKRLKKWGSCTKKKLVGGLEHEFDFPPIVGILGMMIQSD